MYLTTCTPKRGLRPYRRLSLLDDFFAPFDARFDEVAGGLNPAVDIYEKDDKLVFEAELPGIDKDRIKVDVKGELLTISGEHDDHRQEKENGHYRRERRYGRFERSFRLPFQATEAQIEATYKDGVLVLTVDRPEEEKPKQITIN